MNTVEQIEYLVGRFVRESDTSSMTATQVNEAFNIKDGTPINDSNVKLIRKVLKDKGFKSDFIGQKLNGKPVGRVYKAWLIEIV